MVKHFSLWARCCTVGMVKSYQPVLVEPCQVRGHLSASPTGRFDENITHMGFC